MATTKLAPFRGVFQMCVCARAGVFMVFLLDAGTDYVVCNMKDGSVMTWGLGDKGQLGHGDTNQLKSPKKVTALATNAKLCSAGQVNARGRAWNA